MHLNAPRPGRHARVGTVSMFLGLGLTLGMVVALAWSGVWTVEEAVSGKGVDYRGRTSTSHPDVTRLVRLEQPAGTAVGDVLVASFSVHDRPRISAAPTGWTSLLPGRLMAGRRTRLFAYYRVVTASDVPVESWTWRLSRRRAWSGGIARYAGADPDRPIDTAVSVVSSGAAGTTLTVPAVRTTTDGAMLVGGLGSSGGRLTTTPPAGWSKAWDITRGPNSQHAHSRRQDVGTSSGLTWTVSAARHLAGWTAALRPEKGTPPTPTAVPTSTPIPSSPPISAPSPPPTPTPTPAPAVLVGAGDIASCAYAEDDATAALVSATSGTVFALGDNAYDSGTVDEFESCYQPTWGAVRDRTRPVVGNHEYFTASTAAPYFTYFGAAAGETDRGWYSYEIGTDWHVVVLNSNCSYAGGCGAGSPQEQWLRADLAASTRPCTVAMWHHPRFSSGEHGNDPSTEAFWAALYDDGAELVLNGHDHDYERFAPQNPSAVADPTYGIREFVIGTGGVDLRPFGSTPAVNSEVRSIDAHGVLKLTLDSGGYGWRFLPIPGDTLDESGSGACHGAPPA